MKNIFETKIESIKHEITQGKEGIEVSKENILHGEQEIKRLSELKERFQKIHFIKNYERIGDVEKIAQLANKIQLKDLLNSLEDAIDIRVNLTVSDMSITQLTVWQILFLFFGDLESLDRKNTVKEDIANENINEEELQGK